MLPNRSGFEICPLIRETTDAPIFFLTARSTDLDKLSGFAVGADDYITKPFNPLEVVARIKAHLRRHTEKYCIFSYILPIWKHPCKHPFRRSNSE